MYPYKPMIKITEWLGIGTYLGKMRGGTTVKLPANYFSHPRLIKGGVELVDGNSSLVNLVGSFVCIHERRMSHGAVMARWYTVEEWIACVLNQTMVYGFCTQSRLDRRSDWDKPVIQVASVEIAEFEKEVVEFDDLCAPGANMRGWYVWRHPKEGWTYWIGPANLTKNQLFHDPGVSLYDPQELDLSF